MELDRMDQEFETHVRHLAQAFPYPGTPDLAGRVIQPLRGGQRRVRNAYTPAWVWAVALIGLVFAGLMAVPTVRAAVIEFLQIGAIRIFTEEEIPPAPTVPTPQSLPTQSLPGETETPSNATPGYLSSVLELAGEVSLEEAYEKAPFPIFLPTYPPDLGTPDKIFYQQLDGGPGIFLVWFEAEHPEKVQMSLLLLGPGTFAGKGASTQVVETTVNGTPAVWTEGEHLLVLQTGPNQRDLVQLFVSGHVLIWEIGDVTYRLESEFSMEEAVRIAESVE